MSGSLTWREYESDHLIKYSIKVDKSNSRLISASSGESLTNPRGFIWELPPKSLVLRRMYCQSQDFPAVRRSFIVGNPKVLRDPQFQVGAAYLLAQSPTDNSTLSGQWLITGYSGEKFTPPRYIFQTDTGLTDGTDFGD